MEYELGVAASILVFFLGFFVSVGISNFLNLPVARSVLLYVWHTFFCLVYYWYVINIGGDAAMYYLEATRGDVEFNFGTAGVQFLTMVLVDIFGLSFLACFLFYNIFGAVGLLFFDACLRVAVVGKARKFALLGTVIVFLPSISFWSSAIGKDALSFMATCLALWSVLELRRRVLVMALAILLMLLVRPHMASLMVAGVALGVIFQRGVPFYLKALFGGGALAAAAVMVPFALQYAGVGETISSEALAGYIETRQSYNMEGGGGVDISAMSPPMQLITYMFRPFIFEASSVFSFAASIDNLILIYLFVVGAIGALDAKKRMYLSNGLAFMVTYSFSAWLVLAVTTSNLGIAMRQKWMFAPMLIFLLLSLVGARKKHDGVN